MDGKVVAIGPDGQARPFNYAPDPPTCVSCAHFKPVTYFGSLHQEHSKCGHPMFSRDVVTGDYAMYAERARGAGRWAFGGSACGPKGVLWEPAGKYTTEVHGGWGALALLVLMPLAFLLFVALTVAIG